MNCFVKAWRQQGRIISFIHTEYREPVLVLHITIDGEEQKGTLENIFSADWWKKTPEIKKWLIENRYLVEIRGKEFDYHSPHFHVAYKDYEAVFDLKTCSLYRDSGKGMPINFIRDVKKWYTVHRRELEEAWDLLHPSMVYVKDKKQEESAR